MIIVGDDNEISRFPFVTLGIIILCSIVMLGEYTSAINLDWILFNHGFVSLRFTTHFGLEQLSTLFSSIFLHADFWHLLGNMWFLYIFGDNVEDHLGHFNFFIFFIVCGIAGSLVHLLCNPLVTIPAIGASGAIAGVLAAYLLLYPKAPVKVWWGDDCLLFGFRLYRLPAWLIILCWFVLQYVMIYFEVPGVAWHDHIGGFTAGLLAVIILGLKKNEGPRASNLRLSTD